MEQEQKCIPGPQVVWCCCMSSDHGNDSAVTFGQLMCSSLRGREAEHQKHKALNKSPCSCFKAPHKRELSSSKSQSSVCWNSHQEWQEVNKMAGSLWYLRALAQAHPHRGHGSPSKPGMSPGLHALLASHVPPLLPQRAAEPSWRSQSSRNNKQTKFVMKQWIVLSPPVKGLEELKCKNLSNSEWNSTTWAPALCQAIFLFIPYSFLKQGS